MDFEYKMEITADPEEVFAALTNPFQIELWTHTHIPEDVYEEITGGWKEYYLEAIKGMLEMY